MSATLIRSDCDHNGNYLNFCPLCLCEKGQNSLSQCVDELRAKNAILVEALRDCADVIGSISTRFGVQLDQYDKGVWDNAHEALQKAKEIDGNKGL